MFKIALTPAVEVSIEKPRTRRLIAQRGFEIGASTVGALAWWHPAAWNERRTERANTDSAVNSIQSKFSVAADGEGGGAGERLELELGRRK